MFISIDVVLTLQKCYLVGCLFINIYVCNENLYFLHFMFTFFLLNKIIERVHRKMMPVFTANVVIITTSVVIIIASVVIMKTTAII